MYHIRYTVGVAGSICFAPLRGLGLFFWAYPGLRPGLLSFAPLGLEFGGVGIGGTCVFVRTP
jgi:hypothetical protein